MKTHSTLYHLAARPVLVAALVLLIPLVAMHFTTEVKWTLSDFVFAGVLILSVGIPAELAWSRVRDGTYRTAAGLALAGAFLLVWINGAVGITDGEADALYPAVLAIGIVGAFVARFQPAGMARAMFATALALMLVGVGALVAGVVPAFNSTVQILGVTAFLATPFVGSALLFHQAAQGRREGRAA